MRLFVHVIFPFLFDFFLLIRFLEVRFPGLKMMKNFMAFDNCSKSLIAESYSFRCDFLTQLKYVNLLESEERYNVDTKAPTHPFSNRSLRVYAPGIALGTRGLTFLEKISLKIMSLIFLMKIPFRDVCISCLFCGVHRRQCSKEAVLTSEVPG